MKKKYFLSKSNAMHIAPRVSSLPHAYRAEIPFLAFSLLLFCFPFGPLTAVVSVNVSRMRRKPYLQALPMFFCSRYTSARKKPACEFATCTQTVLEAAEVIGSCGAVSRCPQSGIKDPVSFLVLRPCCGVCYPWWFYL